MTLITEPDSRPWITVRQLPSGYWHVRGKGPCNYAQPPEWPCNEATLRRHAHPEASEAFLRAALAEAEGVIDWLLNG